MRMYDCVRAQKHLLYIFVCVYYASVYVYIYNIYIYKICMYENGCMYTKEKDCMNVCVWAVLV